MNLITLDPGISATGYALWEDQSLLTSGTASFPGPGYAERLFGFNKWLEARLLGFQGTLAYEEPTAQYRPHAKYAFAMMGLIEVMCLQSGIRTCRYHPTKIKKQVTGSGKSSKEEVLAALVERYPDHEIGGLDESDAIAVGVTHYRVSF